MSSHQLQIPSKVAAYFGITQNPEIEDAPIITAEFVPGKGWQSQTYKKRPSRSWALKLNKQGVTSVEITCNGRVADFTIEELTYVDRRPLLGGNVI